VVGEGGHLIEASGGAGAFDGVDGSEDAVQQVRVLGARFQFQHRRVQLGQQVGGLYAEGVSHL
jgi:hypothetical protein